MTETGHISVEDATGPLSDTGLVMKTVSLSIEFPQARQWHSAQLISHIDADRNQQSRRQA